jgi:nucleoside-diphosphate-sugar epimerase
MKVFVAGATGALGKQLIPQLVARGHEVTGMTRSDGKRELIAGLGATPVVADALDPDAVGQAVSAAEPEAIIHQLTALSGALESMRNLDRAFAPTNRLRREGTDHLLSAARAAGVRRFVAQSFGGWPYAREGGPVKTEEDSLDPDPVPTMRETLAAIRYLENAVLNAAPIEGIALRYGGFYGPGTSLALNPAGEQVEAVRKRRFPIVGSGDGVLSFIHIDDAATATVAALESGRPGVYNVVDDEPAPAREWLPALAAAVGAKPPRRVPRWVGRLLAGEALTAMMTEARGGSNAKAKRELGWELRYPSWRQGFSTGLG